MPVDQGGQAQPLPSFTVKPNGNSISGLSSGAFMTVQLHVAHSKSFVGAGVIAGGPYRCVESFRGSAMGAEDAYVMNAEYICMAPLTPAMAPNGARLAKTAHDTAKAGLIDPVSHLHKQSVYIFTGTADEVVHQTVVRSTRDFYEALGVPPQNIQFVGDVAAGHCIFTDHVEDSPLDANRPPYINYGGRMQSHDILRHIYDRDGFTLNDPKAPAGELMRFDQNPFVDGSAQSASMEPVGFVYIPRSVLEGGEAKGVHIVLHGCKQGYGYIEYVNGLPAISAQPPFGPRYVRGAGYNEMGESNDLIMLYPQATGADGGALQNPDGCWDWWGYTDSGSSAPDYYSQNAVQIRALHAMLKQLGG